MQVNAAGVGKRDPGIGIEVPLPPEKIEQGGIQSAAHPAFPRAFVRIDRDVGGPLVRLARPMLGAVGVSEHDAIGLEDQPGVFRRLVFDAPLDLRGIGWNRFEDVAASDTNGA